MLDVEAPAGSHDRDDVEADVDRAELLSCEEGVSALHDPKLLRTVDRRGWLPEMPLASRLHLDEHQHLAFEGHEIDLALRCAHAAVEDAVALEAQPEGGGAFRIAAALLSLLALQFEISHAPAAQRAQAGQHGGAGAVAPGGNPHL